MENLRIRTNELAVSVQFAALESLKSGCDKIIPHFNNLGIGSLTTELLGDAILNSCAKITSVASQQAQDDVKAIKSPSIRKSMLEGVEGAVLAFKHECFTMLQGENRNLVKYLTVKKGSIEIIPEAKGTIEEQNTYYISDPKEIELYKLHMAACGALNKFMEALEAKPVHLVNAFKLFPDHAEPADCIYSGFFTSKK